jgi:NTE family protein
VYPSFVFDPHKKDFDFKLARRPQNNFQIDFGGVIATRSISSIYLGLNYYHLGRTLTHFQSNFVAGTFYKAAQVKARIDVPLLGLFYVEPEATFNNWNFLQGKDIIYKDFSPTVLTRVDRKLGINLGIPVGAQYKAVLYGAYISNNDQYIDRSVLVSTDTLDMLQLTGGRWGFNFSTNTLNRKQYASDGKMYSFSGDWFTLNEFLDPGSTSIARADMRKHRSWLRAKITLEQYFRKGIYSSGYYLEGVLSNQMVFENYFGTIINAPAFNPIQDSRTLLLQKFRAFNYAAGGWRNVFSIRKNVDFRLEGYLFKPFRAITDGGNQDAVLNNKLTKLYFAGTAGMVMHTTVGPISFSVNYYDDTKRQLGVLLHVGFLLFNKTSMD